MKGIENFRIKFKAFLAFWVISLSFAFIFTAVLSEAAAQSKHTGIIIGFITGTAVGLVISYYFGNSDKEQISNEIDKIE